MQFLILSLIARLRSFVAFSTVRCPRSEKLLQLIAVETGRETTEDTPKGEVGLDKPG